LEKSDMPHHKPIATTKKTGLITGTTPLLNA